MAILMKIINSDTTLDSKIQEFIEMVPELKTVLESLELDSCGRLKFELHYREEDQQKNLKVLSTPNLEFALEVLYKPDVFSPMQFDELGFGLIFAKNLNDTAVQLSYSLDSVNTIGNIIKEKAVSSGLIANPSEELNASANQIIMRQNKRNTDPFSNPDDPKINEFHAKVMQLVSVLTLLEVKSRQYASGEHLQFEYGYRETQGIKTLIIQSTPDLGFHLEIVENLDWEKNGYGKRQDYNDDLIGIFYTNKRADGFWLMPYNSERVFSILQQIVGLATAQNLIKSTAPATNKLDSKRGCESIQAAWSQISEHICKRNICGVFAGLSSIMTVINIYKNGNVLLTAIEILASSALIYGAYRAHKNQNIQPPRLSL